MPETKYPDWCIVVFAIACLGFLVAATLVIGGVVMGSREIASGAMLGVSGWLLVIYVVLKRTKPIYDERSRNDISN